MAEIQDIFNQYGKDYDGVHRLPPHILKTMKAISRCRTSALGAHIDHCEDCGTVLHVSYNSCRNRHCPKCQTLSKERWIEARKQDLLNVGYFHVVFTIPDTLNTLAYFNQKEIYNILLKASAETMLELAADRKYLGAKIGFTSILHTWGQNLMHHPHVHCVVPGGGISAAGNWQPSRKKFFISVKVLSRKFRGKFLHHLGKAKLEFSGDLYELQDPVKWSAFLSSLYQKEWIVYCKPPFKNAGCVVEYLGRYTHRVAISNSRIVKFENDRVSFKWRDYKDNNKWKVMTVTAQEFIRRFLIHILPPGFTKIRHYGFLSNRDKSKKLKLCRKLTGTFTVKARTTTEIIQKLTGEDISRCPCCGSERRSRIVTYANSS